MKEVAFRSIFPGNNIPIIPVSVTTPTLIEKLSVEISSVIKNVDSAKFTDKIKELEFKILVKEDPVNALLQELKEVSDANKKGMNS